MRRWTPALAVIPLLLAGCGSQTAASTDEPAAAQSGAVGDGLSVVAAVYPLAWVAEQVAPGAEVDLLNQGGQEAHDLDLSPPQRAAIETADVVLYTGDIDYQPQVEKAVASARGEVVSAADVAGDDALLAASNDPHGHEAESHDEAGEEPHSEEAGAVDPHLWFDPSIMAEVALAAAEAFSAADPDNAGTYEQNAQDVVAQLQALETDLEATLGGQCRFDEAIVSHAAYAYLLEPYGKEQHAVTGVGAEGDASAAQLAEIVGEIRAEGFTHVLAEPVEGRDGAEAVVREAGVEMLEVVPLDAVTEEQAAEGLPELVRQQASSFATALGCE